MTDALLVFCVYWTGAQLVVLILWAASLLGRRRPSNRAHPKRRDEEEAEQASDRLPGVKVRIRDGDVLSQTGPDMWRFDARRPSPARPARIEDL